MQWLSRHVEDVQRTQAPLASYFDPAPLLVMLDECLCYSEATRSQKEFSSEEVAIFSASIYGSFRQKVISNGRDAAGPARASFWKASKQVLTRIFDPEERVARPGAEVRDLWHVLVDLRALVLEDPAER